MTLPPEIVARFIASNGIPMDGKTRAEVYQWNLPTGKTHWYSIDAARHGIELLNMRTQAEVTPADAAMLLERNQSRPDPDSPAVDAADLSKPVILGTMETPEGLRHTLIDGWHRVAKAVKTHHQEPLRAYVLPPELTEACCIAITQE